MDDDLAVGESAGRPILDPFDPVDVATSRSFDRYPRGRTLAPAADTTAEPFDSPVRPG